MANYVDYLSETNKSATIRRRINSLGTVLKLSKNLDPTKDPEVILALKRMHRKLVDLKIKPHHLPKAYSANYLITVITVLWE